MLAPETDAIGLAEVDDLLLLRAGGMPVRQAEILFTFFYCPCLSFIIIISIISCFEIIIFINDTIIVNNIIIDNYIIIICSNILI